jgi:hypothetical protein
VPKPKSQSQSHKLLEAGTRPRRLISPAAVADDTADRPKRGRRRKAFTSEAAPARPRTPPRRPPALRREHKPMDEIGTLPVVTAGVRYLTSRAGRSVPNWQLPRDRRHGAMC